MKIKNKIKALLLGICMLAAGICYMRAGSGTWTSLADGEIGKTADLKEAASAEAEPVEKDQAEGAEHQIDTADALNSTETEDSGRGNPGVKEKGRISDETGTQICYVYICGEIVNPGVYRMEEGSRVFQTVELAGGFTEQAAVEYLNMADTVQDGMKLVVPSKSELEEGQKYGLNPGLGADSGSALNGAGASLAPVKVNLNTAGREELMTLKGIGEAKADDIIKYRKEQGPFRRIEDIMKISGIKEAAFQKIKNDITV